MRDVKKKQPLPLLFSEPQDHAQDDSDLFDMFDYLGIEREYFRKTFNFKTDSSNIFEQKLPTCVWLHDEQQTILCTNNHFLNHYRNSTKKHCYRRLMGKDNVCGCCQSRRAFRHNAPQHCHLCSRQKSAIDINTFHFPLTNRYGDRFILKSSLHIDYSAAMFEDIFIKEQEQRSYQDILVSCSACHRIKDSEDSWVRADTETLAHFSGRISHGICPECITLLYPNLFDSPDDTDKKLKS